jgi:hypothetical protein
VEGNGVEVTMKDGGNLEDEAKIKLEEEAKEMEENLWLRKL